MNTLLLTITLLVAPQEAWIQKCVEHTCPNNEQVCIQKCVDASWTDGALGCGDNCLEIKEEEEDNSNGGE